MNIVCLKPANEAFPTTLLQIPGPPQQLYVLGNQKLLQQPMMLSIVGSRALTPYGKHITTMLATAAAEKGIVVVSGMALGVDGVAHRAALQAGGSTIAVLANGLDRMYPATHRQLAKQILEQGGAIISEYPEGTQPHQGFFVARNRLISGLSQAVLITEAAAKSGSLHTARFALDQNRDVLAVPGNITSPLSSGTNNLIKMGAVPITSPENLWAYFGLDQPGVQTSLLAATPEEQIILELLQQGLSLGHELQAGSQLSTTAFNQALSMLEITGRIKPLGANHWTTL